MSAWARTWSACRRTSSSPSTALRSPELRGALGAHVARADRGGPAAQVVALGRDGDRAGDAHEGVGRALVVDAQRGDPVAGQRAALDRVRAGVEDEVVAVEHEPDRHDVGPAVVARRGELAGARALADEGAPLGVVHGAGHGAKIPGMSGPPPDLFDALPEQYFTRIVDAAAAARALPGPRADRPRPRQPRPAAAAGRARGAAGRARGLGRHARLPALPGPRRAARGDRGALPRRPRRGARSRARGRGGAGDQDGDHARRAGLRGRGPGRRPARPRLPGLPVRRRPGAGARGSRCRSTPPPAGSPTSTRWATSAPRSWSSTTPPTRARRARRRGRSRPPSRGRTSAAAGCSTTSPTPSWPSTGAARAACSRSTAPARWPSSCGRPRRSTAWPAGAWASRSATRRSSGASACCSTTSPPASRSRSSSAWWRR